jgi:hypothetical protein
MRCFIRLNRLLLAGTVRLLVAGIVAAAATVSLTQVALAGPPESGLLPAREPLAACAPELVIDPHLVHDFGGGAVVRHPVSIIPPATAKRPRFLAF